MPTYAVLGATGKTGSAILEILSRKPDNKIHAFVRSASKLKKQWPKLVDSGHLQIFEGQLDDTSILANCLDGTRAAFLCIAATINEPYCTIAQDTATSVIKACSNLRDSNKPNSIPRLVQLNSSSTSPKLSESLGTIGHAILYRGNWWIYEDLIASENLFRAQCSWLDVTYIKPGGLIQAPQKGHKLSTERQQTFLGWLDLAAGMVEVAEEESEVWRGREVSVLPVAEDVPIEWRVPIWMVMGFVLTYFPWVYAPAKRVGLL